MAKTVREIHADLTEYMIAGNGDMLVEVLHEGETWGVDGVEPDAVDPDAPDGRQGVLLIVTDG